MKDTADIYCPKYDSLDVCEYFCLERFHCNTDCITYCCIHIPCEIIPDVLIVITLVLCVQMRIHSSASHKLPTSKCSDYFFNYFTLGLVSWQGK